MDQKSLKPTRGDIEVFQDCTTEITRTKAIIAGYVLYWNGKICERGHNSPRYTKTGHCKECYREFRAEEIDQKDISKDLLPKFGVKQDTITNEEKLLMAYDLRELRKSARDHGLSQMGTKRMLSKSISEHWRKRLDK